MHANWCDGVLWKEIPWRSSTFSTLSNRSLAWIPSSQTLTARARYAGCQSLPSVALGTTAIDIGGAGPSKTQSLQVARKSDSEQRARETLNKTIPSLLASNPRARQGIESAELIASANPKASVSNSETPNAEHRVRIVHTNTLSAAAELHRAGNKNGRLAILSMATPMRPGSGFLTGTSSQEDFLCIRPVFGNYRWNVC